MNELASQQCVPCRGGVPKLQGADITRLMALLNGDWQCVDEHHLEKAYKFKNFVDALAFTNAVGAIAEEQNHHPDILTTWGKTKVTIWTHKIDGLTESDFYFAAKVEEAYKTNAM
ncbi:MAG TPA: 4a-hydroxytetrahydrobiopterin dehydratase [Candidatus Hydrogenedentes bacterium]|nr:4a-hydroxytetrahydrobiopterin dehydratase [Candidatus Hydrogenedentota bacterium]